MTHDGRVYKHEYICLCLLLPVVFATPVGLVFNIQWTTETQYAHNTI